MASKTTYGSVKRFGPRYGRRIRVQLGYIESLKSIKKCPYCLKDGIKRIAIGIFQCRKCGIKFTGKAYSPLKVKKDKTIIEEEEPVIEEPVKEEDENG